MSDGHDMYRIQDATPSELRQAGRWAALYAFAYWEWVQAETDYPIGKVGTREQMERPTPDTIREDGTVVDGDTVYETAYTLGGIELLAPNEWPTPTERAENQIRDAIAELDRVPDDAITDLSKAEIGHNELWDQSFTVVYDTENTEHAFVLYFERHRSTQRRSNIKQV